MIIKNITFVVPIASEQAFLTLIFHATDAINQWVDDIKAYKISEQIEPESYNIAIQLGFSDQDRLNTFNSKILERMIFHIQSGMNEPLLYFESHLVKIF